MNKAQAALVLAAGVALGVGGRAVLDGPAAGDTLVPFVHAVDLRRSSTPDAGVAHVAVYATDLAAPAGQRKDLGEAASCAPSSSTLETCTNCMNGLAHECSWPKK